MIFRLIIHGLHPGLDLIVITEPLAVGRGIFIAYRFVCKESQGLVFLDCPSDFFVDVRRDKLGAPETMISPDESFH